MIQKLIYIYVENTVKNEKNTWKIIDKAIGERYLVKVKLFPRAFPTFLNHSNESQKVPTDIKKIKIKNCIGRNFICAGVEDLS